MNAAVNNVPKLRFKEFSGEWENEKLGETISQFIGGGTPDRKNKSFYGGNIPWITVKDLSQDNFKDSAIEYITEKGLNSSAAKIIEAGNFIISTRMGLGRGFINLVDMAINQDMKGLVPKKDILNTKFLMYWFKGISQKLKNLGAGSTVKGIDLISLKSLLINFPLLQEQQKIADFLSSVDSKIQALKQQQQLLQQYKKGMMQKLFSQQIRFKDDNGQDYPEWEEKELGDIALFLKGKGISKSDITIDGEIPCIRYGELYTHYNEIIAKTIYSSININTNLLVLSESNDVIIPASGETKEDIARASCILHPNIALGSDINIIRSKLNGIFLAYYLSHYRNKEISTLAQGVSVIHLYANQLKTLLIDIPIEQEQQKIADCLSAIDQKIEQVTQKIDYTEQFKQGLLQQLFV